MRMAIAFGPTPCRARRSRSVHEARSAMVATPAFARARVAGAPMFGRFVSITAPTLCDRPNWSGRWRLAGGEEMFESVFVEHRNAERLGLGDLARTWCIADHDGEGLRA